MVIYRYSKTKEKGDLKMRVTKTIREYIEKKVDEKISEKYLAEKLEAEKQEKVRSEILETASFLAEEAFKKAILEGAENIDFLEIKLDNIHFYNAYSLTIKDRMYFNNVHHWRDRKNKEVKEKVDDIVIALELGGTKTDLDKMLSEI